MSLLEHLGVVVPSTAPVASAIKAGDVVQTPPDSAWPLALWIVSEVKAWGVTAYAVVPTKGVMFVRLTNGKFAPVGPATWVMQE